jgi:hypothetical protein
MGPLHRLNQHLLPATTPSFSSAFLRREFAKFQFRTIAHLQRSGTSARVRNLFPGQVVRIFSFMFSLSSSALNLSRRRRADRGA